MELIIIPTRKSSHPIQRINNVKSYRKVGLWSVEIDYIDNSTSRFYAIEKIIEKFPYTNIQLDEKNLESMLGGVINENYYYNIRAIQIFR